MAQQFWALGFASAMAEAEVPEVPEGHVLWWVAFCPLSCRGSRLGVFPNEEECRAKMAHHLLTSSNHDETEQTSQDLAAVAYVQYEVFTQEDSDAYLSRGKQQQQGKGQGIVPTPQAGSSLQLAPKHHSRPARSAPRPVSPRRIDSKKNKKSEQPTHNN